MSTAITFPGLGITLDPSPVVFTLFGKPIYWYGLIIACGMLFGWFVMDRLSPSFGLTGDDVIDVLMACIPIGVVGARVYYCVFYWELFRDDPLSVFRIWEGGLAIYGGVIFGVLGLFLYSKRKNKSFGSVLDLSSFGVLIGQIAGRWGNFINREAHGRETDLPWRMGLWENGKVSCFHPTFLYESLWNLIGLIILFRVRKKKKYDGQLFAFYLFWYGLGRAWIEGLRTDSLYLFKSGIRVSQLLAAVCVFAAGGYMLLMERKLRKKDAVLNASEEKEKASEASGSSSEPAEAAAESPEAEPAREGNTEKCK